MDLPIPADLRGKIIDTRFRRPTLSSSGTPFTAEQIKTGRSIFGVIAFMNGQRQDLSGINGLGLFNKTGGSWKFLDTVSVGLSDTVRYYGNEVQKPSTTLTAEVSAGIVKISGGGSVNVPPWKKGGSVTFGLAAELTLSAALETAGKAVAGMTGGLAAPISAVLLSLSKAVKIAEKEGVGASAKLSRAITVGTTKSGQWYVRITGELSGSLTTGFKSTGSGGTTWQISSFANLPDEAKVFLEDAKKSVDNIRKKLRADAGGVLVAGDGTTGPIWPDMETVSNEDLLRNRDNITANLSDDTYNGLYEYFSSVKGLSSRSAIQDAIAAIDGMDAAQRATTLTRAGEHQAYFLYLQSLGANVETIDTQALYDLTKDIYGDGFAAWLTEKNSAIDAALEAESGLTPQNRVDPWSDPNNWTYDNTIGRVLSQVDADQATKNAAQALYMVVQSNGAWSLQTGVVAAATAAGGPYTGIGQIVAAITRPGSSPLSYAFLGGATAASATQTVDSLNLTGGLLSGVGTLIGSNYLAAAGTLTTGIATGIASYNNLLNQAAMYNAIGGAAATTSAATALTAASIAKYANFAGAGLTAASLLISDPGTARAVGSIGQSAYVIADAASKIGSGAVSITNGIFGGITGIGAIAASFIPGPVGRAVSTALTVVSSILLANPVGAVFAAIGWLFGLFGGGGSKYIPVYDVTTQNFDFNGDGKLDRAIRNSMDNVRVELAPKDYETWRKVTVHADPIATVNMRYDDNGNLVPIVVRYDGDGNPVYSMSYSATFTKIGSETVTSIVSHRDLVPFDSTNLGAIGLFKSSGPYEENYWTSPYITPEWKNFLVSEGLNSFGQSVTNGAELQKWQYSLVDELGTLSNGGSGEGVILGSLNGAPPVLDANGNFTVYIRDDTQHIVNYRHDSYSTHPNEWNHMDGSGYGAWGMYENGTYVVARDKWIRSFFIDIPGTRYNDDPYRDRYVDLTGDGKLDFIWREDTGRMFVITGNGDGTFGSGDAASFKTPTLTGYRINADGSWAWAGTPWTTYRGWQDRYMDIDMDGLTDIVIEPKDAAHSDTLDNAQWYFINRGNGNFDSGLRLWDIEARLASGNVQAVAALMGLHTSTDIDGDGRQDYILNLYGDQSRMRIAIAQEDGSFVDISGLKDINEDGKLDALVAANGEVLLQVGNGRHVGMSRLDTIHHDWINQLAVDQQSDLNGDGILDARVLLPGSTSISWFGDGRGSFLSSQLNGDDGAGQLTHLDGNDSVDIVRYDSLGRVWTALGDTATPNWQRRNDIEALATWSTTGEGQIWVLDVSGDGIADVITLGNDGRMTQRLGSGNGTYGSIVVDTRLDLGPGRHAWVGDSNSDGRLDLSYIGSDGAQRAYIYDLFTDVNGDGRSERVIQAADGSLTATFFDASGNAMQTVASRVRDGASTLGTNWTVDINGDGLTDRLFQRLDAGDSWTSSIVALAQTDGTFSTPYLTNGWDASRETLWGDTTGDGRADAVLVLQRSGARTMHFGVGDGMGGIAWVQTDVSLGTGDGSYTLTDINGDGRSELVFTATDGSMTAAFLGSDGTPWQVVRSQVQGGKQTLGRTWTVDVNGDGIIDRIFERSDLGGGYQGSLIALGQADGRFAAPTLAPGWGSTHQTMWGDITGDGVADAVLVRERSGARTFDIGQGDGAGNLNWRQGGVSFGTGDGIYDLVDINGDGRQELVSTALNGAKKAVFFGANGETWQVVESRSIDNLDTLGRTWLVDVNGDGITDRLFQRVDAGDSWASSIVALGQADGRFAAPTLANGWDASRQTLWGDITGDGKADAVLVLQRSGARTMHFGIGDGAAGISWTQTDVSLGTGDGSYALADLNGDGRNELVFSASTGPSKAVFFRADGGIDFALDSTVVDGAASFGHFTVADVNGDGYLDSVVMPTTAAGVATWAKVAYGQADGRFGALQDFSSDLGSSRLPLIGDVTGDGKADLVWVESAGFNRGIDGQVAVATGLTGGGYRGNPGWDGTGSFNLIDINGDGRQELVRTATDGSMKAVFFNADGSYGWSLDSVTVNGAQALADAMRVDVNGDGLLDSLMMTPIRQGTDAWAAVAYGRADGSFTPVEMLNPAFGYAPTRLVGDVTGDGKADLVWVESAGWNRGIDGKVWLLNGFSTWTWEGQPGFDGTGTFALEDIDGDGVQELVRGSADTATVQVLRFNGGGFSTVTRDATRSGGDFSDVMHVEPGTLGALFGNGGDDALHGSSLSDILDGGTGRNVLRGGAGNDIYAVGAGSDTIRDTGGARDVLSYGERELSDLTISRNGDDLLIVVDTGEAIASRPQTVVKDQFNTSGQNAIERIQVGSVDLSVSQLIQAMGAFGATSSSWSVDLGTPANAVNIAKLLGLAGSRA